MTMLENRNCGECSLCCFTHTVEPVPTEHHEWCVYCKSTGGCGIYLERPINCRVFRCEWLEGMGSDDERPDKTNIVVERQYDLYFDEKIVMMAATPTALESDYARTMTLEYLRHGLVVVHMHVDGRCEVQHE